MRKNIKNNMITRILAIGLATAVFATSAPASVFADDEETVTVESSESSSDSSSDSSSESSSESSSDSSESVSCESEAPAVEATPEVTTEAVPEVATEAAPEVAPVAEEGTIVAEVLIIDNNVAPAQEEPVVEGEQEAAPAQDTPAIDPNTKEGVLALKADAEEKIEKANQSIDNLNNNTASVNEVEDQSSSEADSAVENAGIANTSPSKKEAYQAKADAISDITAAEADLENANAAYEGAVEAKVQAEEDVKAAEEAHAKAVEHLNQLKNTAQQNLTAAQAQYNDAASRANALQSQINVLSKKKEDLEKIETQYYAVLDHYYRNVLGIYETDENGVLDVQKSAEKVKNENPGLFDTKAKGAGDDMFRLGRSLMEDLITYMLVNDGNSDVKIPHYELKDGEKMPNEKTEINTPDGKKKIKYANDVIGYNADGKPIVNTSLELWDDVSGKDGRDNHIVVTYTDKNGDTQTVNFNYVFKSSTHDSEDRTGVSSDIDEKSPSPIYLAIIKKDGNNWTETRAASENNFDDYSKLTQEISDLKTKIATKEVEKKNAEAAASAAAARVSQYSQELRELNSIQIDDSKITELKERLADAVEDLKEAEEKKEALTVQVEEARKIVDAIDLSRFRTNDDDSSSEESSDSSDPVLPVYPLPTIADIPELIPTIPTVLPTVITSFPTSGVLGVRTVASAGTDEEVSDVAKKPAVKEIVLGDKTVADNNGKKLVKLDNNLVPLAAAPGVVEANGFNWWWILLLVGTAVVIFVVVYKKRKEEDEAKAVNK